MVFGKDQDLKGNKFRVGKTPWNKGKKMNEEKYLSLGMRGKHHSEDTKNKIKLKHKGKHFSPETEFKKGNHPKTEFKKGIHPKTQFKKGVVPKTAFKKGMKPWNYIDGRSKFLGPDRYGDDWNKIRLTVYKRDNYSCQECGITMSETKKAHHVHHKKPFIESEDNSIKNLITLCPPCHRKIEAKLMRERKLGGKIR